MKTTKNLTRSPSKSAIVIGVTGQDGAYLSRHLLNSGYVVIGVKRRSSISNTERIDNIDNPDFHVCEGDVSDYSSMSGVFRRATATLGGAPHEVYNLAAQSHVGTSFDQPLATWDSTAQGVLNILEIIRQEGYVEATRFYQASTSEMFGDNYRIVGEQCSPPHPDQATGMRMVQDETVQFNPRSPYAIAKTAAHQAVGLYRDAYGVFGCCGILFNHESPMRGENFVTRKITMYVAKLYHALQLDMEPDKLALGNMASSRDWGHAEDYVRAMHMMLQHHVPDDYIVATGRTHSVKDFCKAAFGYIGVDYEKWVTTDPRFMRPAEVPHLCGVSDKAQNVLGWKPKYTFEQLVQEMVQADIEAMG